MSKLLTIDEVADTLRLHQQSVRTLIKNGELRAAKVGTRGAYRIRESDVEDYLESVTVNA